MPRRPPKTKHQHRPPGFGEPHERNLQKWLDYLEIEFVSRTITNSGIAAGKVAVKFLETERGWSGTSFEPVDRQWLRELVGGLLPEKLTEGEQLSELLIVIWADYRLWQGLCESKSRLPPPPELQDKVFFHFIQLWYNLHIPFNDSVWLELKKHPKKWTYLSGLMVANSHRFFWVQSESPYDDITLEHRALLSEQRLGDTLHKYAQNPLKDWRPWLSSQNYPKPVIERLRAAAAKLADDAAWCTKHPGRIEAPAAPAVAHRIRKLKEAKVIEEMVVLLHGDAGLSDYAAAKRCMGRLTGAGRRLAGEARLLAFYRDGLPVKFHKSRGDKNAP